jgi:hypothetical protein
VRSNVECGVRAFDPALRGGYIFANALVMKAILLTFSVAVLCVLDTTAPAAGLVPKALSKAEVEFLDNLRKVRIGMSEDELRQIFPDLGVFRKPDGRSEQQQLVSDFPCFTLAALEWSGSAEFATGKLVRVSLYASGVYPEYADGKRQSVPRHNVRKAGLLIAARFQRDIGNVTERYVPNVDCPSGNPYGLRHTWRAKGKALLVEFHKDASSSSVTIILADWVESQREQKESPDGGWPLKPVPRALLREVATPR